VSLSFHSVLRKFIKNLPNFGSFGYSVSEIFFRNNQKQELPMVAMFNGSGQNEQSL
jgi:hypothetical protein